VCRKAFLCFSFPVRSHIPYLGVLLPSMNLCNCCYVIPGHEIVMCYPFSVEKLGSVEKIPQALHERAPFLGSSVYLCFVRQQFIGSYIHFRLQK